jgi:hypothetical protein
MFAASGGPSPFGANLPKDASPSLAFYPITQSGVTYSVQLNVRISSTFIKFVRWILI